MIKNGPRRTRTPNPVTLSTRLCHQTLSHLVPNLVPPCNQPCVYHTMSHLLPDFVTPFTYQTLSHLVPKPVTPYAIICHTLYQTDPDGPGQTLSKPTCTSTPHAIGGSNRSEQKAGRSPAVLRVLY